MNEALKTFAENGFVVLPSVLTAEEIARVNDGIDADAAANPEAWAPGPRPGFVTIGCAAPELLHRTDALDGLLHHPAVMPMVRAILGDAALFSHASFMRREPCDADVPDDRDGGDPLCLSRNWHREYAGIVEGAEANPYYAPAVLVIYYLDDVDENSHCTSLIPESAAAKRALPKVRESRHTWGDGVLRIDDADTAFVDPERPDWTDAFGRTFPRRIGRVDVHASAGSAVLFNTTNYHCGTVRRTERFRRTTHVFYRLPEPTHSRHGLGGDFATVADFHAALPDRTTLCRPATQAT